VHHSIEAPVISHQLCNCSSALGSIGDITAQDHWRSTGSSNICCGFLGCFWATHANANDCSRCAEGG
jgi:hypothetical protein